MSDCVFQMDFIDWVNLKTNLTGGKIHTAKMASPLSPLDASAQLTTFKSYVALIADPTPGSKYT